MRRRFTATDLVQLPKLDVLSAQTLGTEVLSNARAVMADKGAGKKIPEGVVEALDDVALSLSALTQAAAARLPVLTEIDPQRAKAADVVLDAIYSGLLDVLNGWSKIPGLHEAEMAASLKTKLFPGGLKFIQIAYKLQWAESNTRLLVIRDQGLEPQLKKLGAAKILEALHAAHREYGEALGITTPSDVEAEPINLRDALEELVAALRMFVVRTTGMVTKKDPTKAELAEQLLSPISMWETPGGRGRTAEAEADTTAEPPAPSEAAAQTSPQ